MLLVVTVRWYFVCIAVMRSVGCVVMCSCILVWHSILSLMTVRIILMVWSGIVVTIMVVALVLVRAVRVRQVVVRRVDCPGVLQIVMHVLLIVLKTVMVPSNWVVHRCVVHGSMVGSSISVVVQIVIPGVVFGASVVVVSGVVLDRGTAMV